jgi:carboxypeptidase C (cathepsin A)
MNRLGLDASARANIRMAFYDGGHMLYTDTRSLEKLTKDVAAFVADAIPSGK